MTPSVISSSLFTQFLASTPTAVNALADTPTSAVATVGPKFNPMKKMLDAIVTGWVRGLKTVVISGQYIGTVGAVGTAAPVVINFVNAPGATASLFASMGWKGPSSVVLLNLFTTNLAATTTANMLLQVQPIPGAGSGTFVVTPLHNAGLASATGVFHTTLTTAFQQELVFGPALNPQISKLITALSTAFAIMVASATGATAVAGPVGPSPYSIPYVGKYL
tara:strand:- start:106 stop:768 length:663 start_codon:yes stop_codon:yes gene_type:complete